MNNPMDHCAVAAFEQDDDIPFFAAVADCRFHDIRVQQNLHTLKNYLHYGSRSAGNSALFGMFLRLLK
jgi:hypothetical protein